MRVRFTAAVVTTIAVALGVGILPAAAAAPHENPDSTPLLFDGVSLLWKYAEVLDYVLRKDAYGVEAIQDVAPLANIHPRLRDTVDEFLASSRSLALLLPQIELQVENYTALLAESRPDEAEAELVEAAGKLQQAYADLRIMGREAEVTGQWWTAATAPEGSSPQHALEEVRLRLSQVRRLLDLFSEIHISLSRQVTQWVGMQAAAAEDITSGTARSSLLQTTGLTLSARPGVAFAGDRIEFYGALTARGEPLAGRKVTILVGGSPLWEGLTEAGGAFEGYIDLLYGYASEMNIQAVYYPQGSDIGRYLASPFAVQSLVPAETGRGQHSVSVRASPWQRYAPPSASAKAEVTKAAPIIQIDAPWIVLLPSAVNLRGKVYSNLGPLQDASLRITLGDREISVRSRGDGTFAARLSPGMGLRLVGTQELRVSVAPAEPWHRPASLTISMLAVNPANIVGLFVALAILVVLGVYRMGRMAVPAPAGPQPAPALVRPASPSSRARSVELEAGGEPLTLLLALYRAVLRLVERVAATALRPNHTLREFVRECAPRLGPLATYFHEFTLMVERLLYSRRRPSEAEAAQGRELGQRLKEGLGSENP